MVFDDWLNGVPIAYIITSSSKQLDFEPWMRALANKSASVQKDCTMYHIMYDTKCPQGDEMGPWAIRQLKALMAQIKHRLMEPSQVELHFRPNDDGNNMSLKCSKDFLEHQWYMYIDGQHCFVICTYYIPSHMRDKLLTLPI